MKRIFYLGALALVLFACKKGNEKGRESETVCFDGNVKWYGDPAADGLGWVIVKDDSLSTFKVYVPQNLPDSDKVDQLKVSVCLSETEEKLHCFCAQPMSKYRIVSLQRR